MSALKQIAVGACAALWLTTGYLAAEDATPSPTASDMSAVAAEGTFPPDQIAQLVAPIALYPDALIAQILMASTYPLDVVQAARWVANNGELEGEALETASGEQGWDPSVTTLAFFPEVLDFMSTNLDWTQDLGDAVLAQQKDVTDAVQQLRHEAQAAGSLQSSEQQRVETKGDTIIVQPAKSEVVYVPSYSPSDVYGGSEPPATTYYPATYSQPAVPTYVDPAAVTTGEAGSSFADGLIGFGAGALAGGLLTAAIRWDDDDDDDWDSIYYGGPGYYGGPSYWSGPSYWNSGWKEPPEINIDRNVERGDIGINKGFVGNEIKAGKWEHNPVNRGGVRYRNANVEKKLANVRRERYVDRDVARGRAPDRRAPKLDGAKLPGKLDAPKLSGAQQDRLARSGEVGRELGDRTAAAKAQGRAPKLAEAKRPTARAAVKKPQVKKPVAKPQVRNPTKRPANVSPKTKQAVAKKRPTKQAATPAKRSASRGGSGSSAFKVNKGSKTRAASNRGAQSRSGGGGKRGGGGRRR